jgi:hypothetical protein
MACRQPRPHATESVLEVAVASGDKHDAVLVAASHGIAVTNGTSRVSDRSHSSLACCLYRVTP